MFYIIKLGLLWILWLSYNKGFEIIYYYYKVLIFPCFGEYKL